MVEKEYLEKEMRKYLGSLPKWINASIYIDPMPDAITLKLRFRCRTHYESIHGISVLRNKEERYVGLDLSFTDIDREDSNGLVLCSTKIAVALSELRPHFFEQDPKLGAILLKPMFQLPSDPKDSLSRYLFNPTKLKRPSWSGSATLNGMYCSLCHKIFVDKAMWGGGNLQWVHQDCWIDLATAAGLKENV